MSFRHTCLAALTVVTALGAGLGAGSSPPPIPTLAITNVTVIDGTDAPPTITNVIVREGLVRRVTSDPPPAGSTVVDGTGKFLIPGLWDMHVHLATRPEPELAEKTMMPRRVNESLRPLLFLECCLI